MTRQKFLLDINFEGNGINDFYIRPCTHTRQTQNLYFQLT